MEYVLALLILLAIAVYVSAPLRRGRGTAGPRSEDPQVAELEARKEAKYREIREAEMDHAQGKLSEADFRRHDAELRREAIEILKQLDRLGERKDASG